MTKIGDNIDLLVITIAYNHQQYIAQAFESVLSQETNYSYQMLVIDDGSNDGTQDIIREYQVRFPDKILSVLHPQNYGHAANAYKAANITPCSKYFAFLDGDDYWCNKNKIQKQIDLLEQYPKLSGVSHATLMFHEQCPEKNSIINASLHDWTIADMVTHKHRLYCHTSSWIRRNNFNKIPLEEDSLMSFIFAEQGPIKYIDEVMSVYRITNKGIWTSLSKAEKDRRNLVLFDEIDKALNYKYHKELDSAKKYHIFWHLTEDTTTSLQQWAPTTPTSKEFLNKSQIFTVFGATELGQRAIWLLSACDKKIAFFLDNSPTEEKASSLGYPIYSPSLNNINQYPIIIASSFEKEISEQLESLGAQYYIDIKQLF